MILTFRKKSQLFNARKRKKTRKTPDFIDYAVDHGNERRSRKTIRKREKADATPILTFLPIVPILQGRRPTATFAKIPISRFFAAAST
jgi:hypothetical protein